MRKILVILFLTLYLNGLSQEVKVVKSEELQEIILDADQSLTVFNFWATWCAPCLKELPHFDALAKKFNVKVYLVSVDFQNQLENVKSAVKEQSIQSEVLFLDEKNSETYITKVSKEWTGAIPATLFVTSMGKTYFHENAFTKEKLEKTINKYLN